ncbi:bifunctional DNA primase/polymerase [Macrococcoides caseolyticum]|uniref:bifunctional DNA primase/polymerase n=1 Tax=Macrococcoides caseolyticum TaxID=69966 RepID=UPI000C320937|nr:bifunctional DNA primase/polymerase [Macrococcus caseolyticus]PKE19431.1 DNA primase [Macrococcus caseolyticus]PKF40942.1 DNA primase [Macrococcus caseolyticus]
MSGYDVAIKLLDSNIQVVPLNKYKKPSTKFKDVTIDREYIDHYKSYYLNTKVLGVLTRGVWCIDIDINHKENENGLESLKAIPYYDELKSNIDNTLVQTTASGGKHIIFKKREDINYSQKINYLPSVDIKAHDNNYFVLAGSVTDKGTYTKNNNRVTEYVGEFERRIFSKPGSFEQQVLERFTVKSTLPDYDTSHLKRSGKGGLGKQAYTRIVDGQSTTRNDDLFKAVSYALRYNIDIEPLRVLIWDNKNGDIFTESQWEATVQSARNNFLF